MSELLGANNMKAHKTKWRRKVLSWFYSGRYWYVTIDGRENVRPKSSVPVGCGTTQAEAFADFKVPYCT